MNNTTIPDTAKGRHAAFLSLRQDALTYHHDDVRSTRFWDDAYAILRAANAAGDKWTAGF